MTRILNILIVRLSSLGDIVHTFPVIADLRQHYPHARIDWVVEEAYVELVRTCAGVDDVIGTGLRRWRKQWKTTPVLAEWRTFYRRLRQRGYDLVIDPQGLLKSALVMRCARLVRGGKRVGLANATDDSGYEPLSRWLHTASIAVPARAHAVERGRLLAAGAVAALGAGSATGSHWPVDGSPQFRLSELQLDPRPDWMPSGPYTVFFHGTARDAKKLPLKDWIAVGQALQAQPQDGPVLLPWGSDTERETAQKIAAQVSYATVLPRLSMHDAVLLARCASLVIGVDTGLTHVAAAYCRPTIEIYGDSPRWKTEGYWDPCIVNLGDVGALPQAADIMAAVDQVRLTSQHGRATAEAIP